MPGLSPAADAIHDAAYDAWITRDEPRSIAAATLRAAVTIGGLKASGGGVILDGNFLLAIAAELEGTHD